MASDPLYHDDRQLDRMAREPQIVSRLIGLQWVKLATGIVALVLLAAIWLIWRIG